MKLVGTGSVSEAVERKEVNLIISRKLKEGQAERTEKLANLVSSNQAPMTLANLNIVNKSGNSPSLRSGIPEERRKFRID